MSHILLATIGERPAAITMALDWLLPQYQYEEVVLLHTDAIQSNIAQPLLDLEAEIAQHRAYEALHCRRWEMRRPDEVSIIDTDNQDDAEAYFRALVNCFRHYRKEGYVVHVLISGGRKAMSAYAVVAASYVLSYNDRLWASTVDSGYIHKTLWHLPLGAEDALKVVNLPFKASRLTRGQLQDVETFPDLVWGDTDDKLASLMESFTGAQRRVAEAVRNHPYAPNEELAGILGIGVKTLETHLGDMYSKAGAYWNFPRSNRRAFLRDLLEGRA